MGSVIISVLSPGERWRLARSQWPGLRLTDRPAVAAGRKTAAGAGGARSEVPRPRHRVVPLAEAERRRASPGWLTPERLRARRAWRGRPRPAA